MSLFKRLSATLVYRIDQAVGEIENHDAVIHAALTDMHKKIAEARVRLTQIQREAERQSREAGEQQKAAERWRKRAVETATHDENKALECLRRANRCEQMAARAQTVLTQFEQTGEQLAQDIEASEQRLRELKQKQTLMRARQSSGIAMSATHEMEGVVLSQLDDSFDRWEISLGQIELSVDYPGPVDRLEREFSSCEQESALRDELTRLIAKDEK
jgi:phage shock protein A